MEHKETAMNVSEEQKQSHQQESLVVVQPKILALINLLSSASRTESTVVLPSQVVKQIVEALVLNMLGLSSEQLHQLLLNVAEQIKNRVNAVEWNGPIGAGETVNVEKEVKAFECTLFSQGLYEKANLDEMPGHGVTDPGLYLMRLPGETSWSVLTVENPATIRAILAGASFKGPLKQSHLNKVEEN